MRLLNELPLRGSDAFAGDVNLRSATRAGAGWMRGLGGYPMTRHVKLVTLNCDAFF
jgi:hypothetical protein